MRCDAYIVAHNNHVHCNYSDWSLHHQIKSSRGLCNGSNSVHHIQPRTTPERDLTWCRWLGLGITRASRAAGSCNGSIVAWLAVGIITAVPEREGFENPLWSFTGRISETEECKYTLWAWWHHELDEIMSHELDEIMSHELSDTMSHEHDDTTSHELDGTMSHELDEITSHELDDTRSLSKTVIQRVCTHAWHWLMDAVSRCFSEALATHPLLCGHFSHHLQKMDTPVLQMLL